MCVCGGGGGQVIFHVVSRRVIVFTSCKEGGHLKKLDNGLRFPPDTSIMSGPLF